MILCGDLPRHAFRLVISSTDIVGEPTQRRIQQISRTHIRAIRAVVRSFRMLDQPPALVRGVVQDDVADRGHLPFGADLRDEFLDVVEGAVEDRVQFQLLPQTV